MNHEPASACNQADESLRQDRERALLSQKLEAFGGLAGGVAHEFNNLLQIIHGYGRYAMQGLSPQDPRCRDLSQVLKAAERAATLTRQLLNFGRRQAPKAAPGATVLIVDDDPESRNLIGQWLSAAGYVCAEAADARTAWNHLQSHDIHLATLDLRLPDQSGIELLGMIKARFPDTEAVIVSGMDEVKPAIEALTRGACGYLVKPFQREELLFQVRIALERRQLVIENRQYTRNLENRVREQTAAVRRASEESIYRLTTALTYRDEETGAHIRRTGLYSGLLAEAAGWSANEAEYIRMAAPMHDIGKIGIPDAILRKPEKLSPAEYEIMKKHTVIGAGMLAGSESPALQMAMEIAVGHHEQWDGRGYPRGLAGAAIPESARIVSIVDVYDAVTHDRVYRRALPEREALAVMQRGQSTQFDPLLLTLFFTVLPEIQAIAADHPDDPAEKNLLRQFLGESAANERACQLSPLQATESPS